LFWTSLSRLMDRSGTLPDITIHCANYGEAVVDLHKILVV